MRRQPVETAEASHEDGLAIILPQATIQPECPVIRVVEPALAAALCRVLRAVVALDAARNDMPCGGIAEAQTISIDAPQPGLAGGSIGLARFGRRQNDHDAPAQAAMQIDADLADDPAVEGKILDRLRVLAWRWPASRLAQLERFAAGRPDDRHRGLLPGQGLRVPHLEIVRRAVIGLDAPVDSAAPVRVKAPGGELAMQRAQKIIARRHDQPGFRPALLPCPDEMGNRLLKALGAIMRAAGEAEAEIDDQRHLPAFQPVHLRHRIGAREDVVQGAEDEGILAEADRVHHQRRRQLDTDQPDTVQMAVCGVHGAASQRVGVIVPGGQVQHMRAMRPELRHRLETGAARPDRARLDVERILVMRMLRDEGLDAFARQLAPEEHGAGAIRRDVGGLQPAELHAWPALPVAQIGVCKGQPVIDHGHDRQWMGAPNRCLRPALPCRFGCRLLFSSREAGQQRAIALWRRGAGRSVARHSGIERGGRQRHVEPVSIFRHGSGTSDIGHRATRRAREESLDG